MPSLIYHVTVEEMELTLLNYNISDKQSDVVKKKNEESKVVECISKDYLGNWHLIEMQKATKYPHDMSAVDNCYSDISNHLTCTWFLKD